MLVICHLVSELKVHRTVWKLEQFRPTFSNDEITVDMTSSIIANNTEEIDFKKGKLIFFLLLLGYTLARQVTYHPRYGP